MSACCPEFVYPDLCLDERRDLADARVTLNGERAMIMCERKPIAKVATLRSDGPVAAFDWPTVARIVADGGRFTS
jgi:hypothetical protein